MKSKAKVLCLVFIALFVMIASEARSADDFAIVYTRLTGSYWQIWIKKLDGEARQLTSSSFDKRTPVWSKDGQKILYRSNNRELYLFDLDTKEEKQILKKIGWITDPAFFDDQKIVFSRF